MELSIKTAWGQSEAFLRIIELTHKYHSSKESPALSLASASERRSLIELFEGDPEIHRRQHRRFPMRLPAVIQTERGAGHGIVLNFSGKGLFVASKLLAPMGSSIQLKVGQPGELEYQITCIVRHLRRNIHFFGIGCEFCEPPLATKVQQAASNSAVGKKDQPARLRPFVPYHLPVLGRGESLCCLSPA